MKKEEIKRNLLGSLEVALFMPTIEKRFGHNYHEALRSFFIPVFLFPIAILTAMLFPTVAPSGGSDHTLSMLYSLRYAGAVALFLGLVYVIAINIDRKEHFIQFVVANNWAAIPSMILLIPIILAVSSGMYTAQEMLPFLICMIIYSYAFTAFIAMRIFQIPWEMGIFFAFISLMINQGSFEMMTWFAQLI